MIRSVAIVGAGTMGLGIAQVCALSGFDVLLYDVRSDQVTAALSTIEQSLSRSVEKGKLTEHQKFETLQHISTAAILSDLKADLIIEAAIEKLDIKQNLFVELEAFNENKAILASNTSSISISQIGKNLKNPARCVGLHFFNPADRMKLVEIVSTDLTDQAVLEEINAFSKQIGKTAVAAKDSPGFIVNRVARHYYGEALRLLEENVADIQTIDALLRSSGFKMGPFELMDLIGVETNLMVTTSVFEGFNRDPKFRPSKIQQDLVADGRFGMKTGRGFYAYDKK